MSHEDTDRVLRVAGFMPGSTLYADVVAKNLEEALLNDDQTASHEVLRVSIDKQLP